MLENRRPGYLIYRFKIVFFLRLDVFIDKTDRTEKIFRDLVYTHSFRRLRQVKVSNF